MGSWYVLRIFSHHLKLQGPMDLDALKEELSTGKISFSDLVYQPQDRRTWVRAFEIAELLSALPEEPSPEEFSQFESQIVSRSKQPPVNARKESPPVIKKEPGEKTKFLETFGTGWTLQSEAVEYGPYSFQEVAAILESGEFDHAVLLWHEELPNWIKAQNFHEFTLALAAAVELSTMNLVEKGGNSRVHRRMMVVASVKIKLNHITAYGICWDISEGGMQVQQLDMTLFVGAVHKITVTPLLATDIPPFDVHGKIVWVNEATKKMGFQFIDPLEIKTVAAILKKVDITGKNF